MARLRGPADRTDRKVFMTGDVIICASARECSDGFDVEYRCRIGAYAPHCIDIQTPVVPTRTRTRTPRPVCACAAMPRLWNSTNSVFCSKVQACAFRYAGVMLCSRAHTIDCRHESACTIRVWSAQQTVRSFEPFCGWLVRWSGGGGAVGVFARATSKRGIVKY